VPFKDFMSVMGFLASIGLAAAAPSAFSLIGTTTLFGDQSPDAQARIKASAVLLTWASACFTVAIAFVVALQLLHTDHVLAKIILRPEDVGGDVRSKARATCVVHLVGCCAWLALGFQIAGMLLISQSWSIISPASALAVRYGLIGGVVIVGGMALLADTASNERMNAVGNIFRRSR